MTRFWPMLALLLVAATPSADETRQFRVAAATFDDKLYDVSERQFIEFLAKYPTSDRADNAQYLLALAQLNQGKWRQAVKSLEESVARWPDRRPDAVRFWLGEAFTRGEQYSDAAARYAEVVEKYPRSTYFPQALYGQAYALMKLSQLVAAGEALDKLAKLQPKGDLAFEADLLRGQLALAANDYTKADVAFTGIIQVAPDSRAAYKAYYWLGQSLARRQRTEDALKNFTVVTDAFKAKPGEPVDAPLVAETWFAIGWAQWQSGQFALAAEAFANALTNTPSPTLKHDALLKLAEASVRAGKVNEGVAHLRDFLSGHPTDALSDQVQLSIGDLLMGQGDYGAARMEYTTLVSRYTNSTLQARANLQAGWCSWQLRQFPEALKSFQQSLTLARDPGLTVEALEKVADTQFALDQYDDAVVTYQRLISSHPEAKNLDRVLFQLGEVYRRMRNVEAATATFESLVKQYPQSEFAPQAQYNLGQILLGQGKEPEARAAFASVISRFATTQWARNAALAIGESFSREGKYDQAIAEFDKLAAVDLGTELSQQAFYDRGLCFAATGKRDKTLADFTGFMKAHPAAPLAPDVAYWIGDEYLRQKDYLKAQAQFQSLAETYPTSRLADPAQYFAGRSAYSRQDYKNAIELYEGLLKKFPESAWRCDARFGEGDALTELGQFDDALLVFDSLVKQFPDCTLACEAIGRKGDCQFTLRRYEDAVATFKKALDCAKDGSLRAQIQFKAGQSYEKSNKLDDALQYYVKPIYDTPSSDEPPERFWSCKSGRAAAAIKEQQQQWRDAITLYQKLGEACPDLKPLAEDVIRKIRVQHGILF